MHLYVYCSVPIVCLLVCVCFVFVYVFVCVFVCVYVHVCMCVICVHICAVGHGFLFRTASKFGRLYFILNGRRLISSGVNTLSGSTSWFSVGQ